MENQFNIPQDSYLTFDAYTLKQFINDRLNESEEFTDQNFEGSNLSTINNIISYAFNSLMYYLNKTSSESMFSEAQIYENINRIVKVLSYKPIGAQTASLPFRLTINTSEEGKIFIIPRYSYFANNGTAYSFTEDIIFEKNSSEPLFLEEISNNLLLFQGRFREHSIQKSSGEDNFTLTLTTPEDIIIDHFNIHVYVREVNGKWEQWEQTENLYLERASAKKFELRLNENKLYEIKFGDNINGRVVSKNSDIAIYYLESKGELGEAGPEFLNNSSFVVFSSQQFLNILDNSDRSNLEIITPTFVNAENSFASTSFSTAESPNSIRENAPGAFRSQLRLVTKEDYSKFIKTNFRNFIHDVSVANNEEFIRTRISYLHELGIEDIFKDSKIFEGHLFFSDACNFNNVYITAVPRIAQQQDNINFLTQSQKQFIISGCDSRKTLTSQIILLDPVYMKATIGMSVGGVTPTTNDISPSILYVEKDSKSRKTDKDIKNAILNILRDTFNPNNRLLGDTLDISEINNRVLSIDGISKIWTARPDLKTKNEGLRMLLYNPSYSQDIKLINNNTQLLSFQFATLDDLEDISNRIIINPPKFIYETIEA
jgi:DNA-dependent RNA polymerase auxiliary subunit epsilon